jgi:hypothetical protein
MHPIEHLRHVARARNVDAATLVHETAVAMSAMRFDPDALVVACRRVVQRQADCGPLWWFASRLLCAGDPEESIWDLVAEISDDETPRHLARQMPDDATVVVIGGGDQLVDGLVRRGDLRGLCVDSHHSGTAVLRRLERAEVACEPVAPEGLGGAIAAASLVLIQTPAASTSRALGPAGSLAASLVARQHATPVWLVTPVGTVLPDQYLEYIIECTVDTDRPWEAEFELIGLDLIDSVVTPDGVVAPDDLASGCPFAPELLRVSAI